jgi:hypothetical protein
MINAVLIIEAIEKSELLTDEVKMAALNDLLKMYTDDEYFSKVYAVVVNSDIKDASSTIRGHHAWDYSDLGYEFWHKLSKILS